VDMFENDAVSNSGVSEEDDRQSIGLGDCRDPTCVCEMSTLPSMS